LPAGFEIDNPRLVSSGDTGTLAWIADAQEPVNAEFRDDRFSAAFERKSGDPSVFTVAYVVRAVSPGRYVHPQAYVEGMYRPDRFGRTATGTIGAAAAECRGNDRGEGGEMSPHPSAHLLIPTLAVARGRPSRLRRGLRAGLVAASTAIIAVVSAGAYWISSLGPTPLGEGLAFSALVV